MSRRGQISMNTIVYAAIAILVLVLVVSFTTGGLGKLFGGFQETAISDTQTAKAKCSSLCDQIKGEVASTSTPAQANTRWRSSLYCSEQFILEGSDTPKNCWDRPISVTCSVSKKDDVGKIFTGTVYSGGCLNLPDQTYDGDDVDDDPFDS